MLSLVLSTCLLGQPCKEVVIADFYTVMADTMCDTNLQGMQKDLNLQKIPKGETRTLSCKTVEPSKLVREVISNSLILLVNNDKTPEKVTMAKYYGKVAAPLCGRNREFYEPVMQESLRLSRATGMVYCL